MSERDPSEADRLEQLLELGVLDTPRSAYFDAIVERALHFVPGATMAAVSLVDQDRQWFKSAIGLSVREMPRKIAFCAHTIQGAAPLIVPDTEADERFADNPLVTQAPHLRFYFGVPLLNRVGALCVMGTKRRDASAFEVGVLVKLAKFVDIQLLSHGALYQCGQA
jgi:GAF domain-containing protein